jgi:hypothetical protein
MVAATLIEIQVIRQLSISEKSHAAQSQPRGLTFCECQQSAA